MIMMMMSSVKNYSIHVFHVLNVIVIYKALCFDVAQGRMNWAPNEKRTQ